MTICSLLQILFACAEALYAHGYSNEACRLTVELARDLLANPPDLKVEQPPTKVERWQQPSAVLILVTLFLVILSKTFVSYFIVYATGNVSCFAVSG